MTPMFRAAPCASGCRRPAPTSVPASTRSGWRCRCTTTSSCGSTDGRPRRRRRGRGCRRGAARRAQPGRPRACAPASPHRRPAARARGALPEPHPARPRARLVVRGDRRRRVAARALRRGGDELLDDDALLALADRDGGSPRQRRGRLLGGFTIAWSEDGAAGAVRLDARPRIGRAGRLRPRTELATTKARTALLPTDVPHADAALNAGRAALLVAALTSRPDLLLTATEDRLHQEYRRPAMPGRWRSSTSSATAGVPAVVSGAGPDACWRSPRTAELDRHRAWPATASRCTRLEVDRGRRRRGAVRLSVRTVQPGRTTDGHVGPPRRRERTRPPGVTMSSAPEFSHLRTRAASRPTSSCSAS